MSDRDWPEELVDALTVALDDATARDNGCVLYNPRAVVTEWLNTLASDTKSMWAVLGEPVAFEVWVGGRPTGAVVGNPNQVSGHHAHLAELHPLFRIKGAKE